MTGTFNIASCPLIVNRALCEFRKVSEEKFNAAFNAEDGKARELWRHYESIRTITELSPETTTNESFIAWTKSNRPKAGFLKFSILLQWKLDYLESDNLIFQRPQEQGTEYYRKVQAEIRDESDKEEEEVYAWAETRAAADFERNAYGND